MKSRDARVDAPAPAAGDSALDAAEETLCLFREHGAPLLRFCRSVLGHSSDAEDVVQDTFVRLLQHLTLSGDRSNLRAWLFTVAANACRDRVRWRTRWLPWRAELDLRPAPDADHTTDREQAARAALAGLSSRDRLLLSLRAQGLAYRDIAGAAGIREQSVGRLLARALERWKKAVEKTAGV